MISDRVASSGPRVADLRSIVEELQRRFDDVSCHELADIAACEYERLFAVATVFTYLPVLTLRAADQRLRSTVRPIRQPTCADVNRSACPQLGPAVD